MFPFQNYSFLFIKRTLLKFFMYLMFIKYIHTAFHDFSDVSSRNQLVESSLNSKSDQAEQKISINCLQKHNDVSSVSSKEEEFEKLREKVYLKYKPFINSQNKIMRDFFDRSLENGSVFGQFIPYRPYIGDNQKFIESILRKQRIGRNYRIEDHIKAYNELVKKFSHIVFTTKQKNPLIDRKLRKMLLEIEKSEKICFEIMRKIMN